MLMEDGNGGGRGYREFLDRQELDRDRHSH
jgi:hypothetical protein